MMGMHKQRQPMTVLGTVVALALVGVLLAAGPSSASSGRVSTAASKTWSVSVWIAETSARTGTSIPVTVKVDNKTARTISGSGCPGVNFLMDVGNAKVANPIPETTASCTLSITPGVHVFHTKVITTYEGCGGNGVPKCGNPPKFTALPAGTYRTQTIWPELGNTFPKPKPFRVTLTH